MKCPSCGKPASGNFCSSCGEPLKTRGCPSCGSEILSGSRFCTSCGESLDGDSPKPESVAGGGAGGTSRLAWWVAGTFLALLLFALGYPILTDSNQPEPGGMTPQGTGGSPGTSGLVDLTTMPVEEQATILFNRVMTSSSSGDTADVNFFLPKALIIHEQLAPDDPDGLYHFALLHQVAEDHEAALEKARQGLAQVPDYLLLLAVAAESSAALGDSAEAEELYRRFLDVYDQEMALMRPGYEHHQRIFPVYRDEAAEYLNRF